MALNDSIPPAVIQPVSGTVVITNFPAEQVITAEQLPPALGPQGAGDSVSVYISDDQSVPVVIQGGDVGVLPVSTAIFSSGTLDALTAVRATVNQGSVSVQFSGDFDGEYLFEQSNDAITFYSMTMAPNGDFANRGDTFTDPNGFYSGKCSGIYFQVRATVYNSGSSDLRISRAQFNDGEEFQQVSVVSSVGMDVNAINSPVNTYSAALGSTTHTNVTNATSVFTVVGANSNRKALWITNDDASASVYVKFGSSASATSYAKKLAPGEFWSVPLPVPGAQVTALATAASGTLRVTEIT